MESSTADMLSEPSAGADSGSDIVSPAKTTVHTVTFMRCAVDTCPWMKQCPSLRGRGAGISCG